VFLCGLAVKQPANECYRDVLFRVQAKVIIITIIYDRVTSVEQEAARRYILQERDKMLNIKEEMDNEENLLKQLDTRVSLNQVLRELTVDRLKYDQSNVRH